MKAILKCKHQVFYTLVHTYKEKQVLKDKILDELLDELSKCFDSYNQSKNELVLISQSYELKQRKIKQRLKELRRS